MTPSGLNPRFEAGAYYAWILFIPLLMAGFYVGGFRKDVARRLADMAGYGPYEKAFTIAASVAPYPFMVLTVWTPFASATALVVVGLGF